MGIFRFDDRGRITGFEEKPNEARLAEMGSSLPAGLDVHAGSIPRSRSWPRWASTCSPARCCWICLDREAGVDFGRELIPRALDQYRSPAYLHNHYWADVGTVESFYEANIMLTEPNAPFSFYHPRQPIYTHPRFLPPSLFVDCELTQTLVAEGSYLDRCHVEHSVVGIRSTIGQGSIVRRSVLLGADYYEHEQDVPGVAAPPPHGIGRAVVLDRVIVDKNAFIGDGARLVNEAGVQQADGEGYHIRGGIIIVPKGAVIPPGTVVPPLRPRRSFRRNPELTPASSHRNLAPIPWVRWGSGYEPHLRAVRLRRARPRTRGCNRNSLSHTASAASMAPRPRPTPPARGTAKTRVLVVEDEHDIAGLIRHTLERGGEMEVEVVGSGDAALKAAADQPPDLIVLDLNLPVLNGLEVCRLLRQRPATARVPIIMLTARTTESDRVIGLDAGADDYVTKPFSLRELAARVRAVLRRGKPEGPPAPSVYRGQHLVGRLRGGLRSPWTASPSGLTRREFELLRYLVENKNRVLSRDRLLERVWGYDRLIETRSVDVHIGRLRGKLAAAGRQIETVVGLGYRFVE